MLVGLVLLLAFVSAKSCASRDTDIDPDKAIEIARQEIDYEPDQVMVRFTPRGVQSRPYWAVSLSTVEPDGQLGLVTVVVVNAETGEVVEIKRQGR